MGGLGRLASRRYRSAAIATYAVDKPSRNPADGHNIEQVCHIGLPHVVLRDFRLFIWRPRIIPANSALGGRVRGATGTDPNPSGRMRRCHRRANRLGMQGTLTAPSWSLRAHARCQGRLRYIGGFRRSTFGPPLLASTLSNKWRGTCSTGASALANPAAPAYIDNQSSAVESTRQEVRLQPRRCMSSALSRQCST